MSEITRDQFASAVATAISSVYHLYREVDRLMVALREALADAPDALTPVRGTAMGKTGRDPGRLVLRYEYGTLFTAAPPDEDDVEEDDEDENEEETDEDGEVEDGAGKRRKSKPADIAANEPLLAVRIGMYDAGKRAAFEPQLEYSVMSDWKIGEAKSAPGDRFVLQRNMLRRIPRALAMSSGIEKGGRLVTRSAAKLDGGKRGKGKDRRLSCRLPCGVETVPLYSLESAEQLVQLTQGIKAMWSDAIKGRIGVADEAG